MKRYLSKGGGRVMATPKRKRIYALYKGDEYITSGTTREIAADRNVKLKMIERMLTPTYRKQCAEKRKDGSQRAFQTLFRIDDDEDAD